MIAGERRADSLRAKEPEAVLPVRLAFEEANLHRASLDLFAQQGGEIGPWRIFFLFIQVAHGLQTGSPRLRGEPDGLRKTRNQAERSLQKLGHPLFGPAGTGNDGIAVGDRELPVVAPHAEMVV